MANQSTSSIGTRRFDKDLNENVNDFHLPENSWTQARNAINNSITGDLGKLGNEPGNLFCTAAPYTVIGVIHIIADKWLIYSTDNTNSEIGIFEEDKCLYTTVVNDPCLAFNQDKLIIGVTRATSTCTFKAYWDDGLNVSRVLEFTIDTPADNAYTNPNSPVPWNQICNTVNGCEICTNLPTLNCDEIRLARYIKLPCVEVLNGAGSGTLLNGSYMVAVAYAIKGQKINDWTISNIQPLFNHNNAASSLDVQIIDTDQDFDEMIVAIISVTNQQAVARRAGVYSTRQQRLSFDTIDNTWPVIPLEQLPIMTPIANKTDAMYNVNDLLLRVGPTSKEDFNYQPLANQIVAKWQAVEYPADYYRKGGNNTNYLRDEVYPFFIRWVYDTGDKSSSYHIPGRPGGIYTGAAISDFTIVATDDAQPEIEAGIQAKNWIVYNTAKETLPLNTILPDGGLVIAEGLMGYWESTEIYPDDKPQIWNSNINTSPYTPYLFPTNNVGTVLSNPGQAHDLCGQPIRHHKFPDLSTSINTKYTDLAASKIRLMGVKFENIQAPRDNQGVPIPGIVGYEILRGTRNGNKTILAKGLINNMRTYVIPNGASSSRLGMFPNYPYNEVGRPDPFLSNTKVIHQPFNPFGGGGGELNYFAQTGYSQNHFTFHSPETNFTDPYLSAKELKIHGEFNGDVIGKFEKSEEHPKEKLITDVVFLISAISGVGLAALAANGQRTVKNVQPVIPGYSQDGVGYPSVSGVGAATAFSITTTPGTFPPGSDNAQPAMGDTVGINLLANKLKLKYLKYDGKLTLGDLLKLNLAGKPADGSGSTVTDLFNDWTSDSDSYTTTPRRDIDQEDGNLKNIPSALRLFSGLPLFFNYFTQGTDTVLDFFRAAARYRDFALRYHSHAFYNRYRDPVVGNMRRVINNQQYIGPQIADFGLAARINNLYRAKTVAIELPIGTIPGTGTLYKPFANPQVNDVTRIRASAVRGLYSINNFGISVLEDPTQVSFGTANPGSWNVKPTTAINPGNAGAFYPGHSGIQIASSHYASLKQRLRNQYGQINGVMQVPASTCVMTAPRPTVSTVSDTIFGGDTYVGRYTEKNTFFFFYNWLYGQPDGAQFDYTKNEMIPYPRYWGNFDKFETSDFTSSAVDFINPLGGNFLQSKVLRLPSSYYNLDGLFGLGNWKVLFNMRISIRDAYFYLFNSGVKDFFVESEYNVDLRDWGEVETEQHYDPYRYSDTKALFNTKIIKTGNYYKYDQSLSVARLFTNYISWASAQGRDYDPYIAETCFVYQPTRMINSLPAQYESTFDAWYIFLANNYFDFDNNITGVKSINKSGALIFFDAASPKQFQGLDQLETTNGVKLTIGDGGLFSQPMQNIVNADASYEYGSCQNRLSIINTPMGLFWMSQNQGKVFQYDGRSLIELSMQDLKWWFATYLPYKLTEQFPNFELVDNPVIGIGCQAIFDNENGLVYFTKRDYVLLPLPANTVLQYTSSNNFNVVFNGTVLFSVELGDPRFFESACWTVSYDPKSKGWLSYHDWHPTLMIPGKNTFLTINKDTFWTHNLRCDLYCNYYGVDYPFEVEYMVNTVQTVNTLRSIEYILEAYKYAPNCYDRFHVLDFNFDEAVVYNTEQVSGLLKLNLSPKKDPQALLAYPRINFSDIDILYSKEEQKYRIDQFFDITADRGEYNPNAQRMIWNTGANGYIRALNGNNMNYTKDAFQRKKFRHYTNSVFLRRKVSGDKKILVLLTNNKNLYSPR